MASPSAGWEVFGETYGTNVIVVNQRHLRRWMKNYIRYNHEDQTHLGLENDTCGRVVAVGSASSCAIISLPRLGGLHHCYTIAA